MLDKKLENVDQNKISNSHFLPPIRLDHNGTRKRLSLALTDATWCEDPGDGDWNPPDPGDGDEKPTDSEDE